jgi:hypothetical protein
MNVADGTCLEDTYHFLEKQISDDYMIIHAIVERKSDKLRHPHAVIYNKKTGNIHEVSNNFKTKNVVLPFKLWIALGKVSNVKLYTFIEIRKLLLQTKLWTFYHLDLYFK